MNDEVHPLVEWARRSIAVYVEFGRRLEAPAADELTPELRVRAGTFVSLHKKDGQLRGCIGTFVPLRDNVAEEVIENAVAAATRDPRFLPVGPGEVHELDISVDVLSEPEPVDSVDDLDPQQYGVIVSDEAGARRGLLLPMLEPVKTAEQQVSIARQKAFIGPQEPVRLYRFRVTRYH